MDVMDLLKEHEGKGIEFKLDLSSPERVLRTVVAFANTSGGRIIFGVQDKPKRVVGIKQPLELGERLINLISDSIRPMLRPEIEVVPWRKSNLVIVEVYPSMTRPHFLKAGGQDSGVFIRVGASNRRADSFIIDEFKRLARNESFDEQPFPEANYEEIDFRAASEFFKDVRKLKPEDLKVLRLTTKHQNKEVPTVGGLLLFGTNREKYFPDAWIQAGRFEGVDKSVILDSTEIKSFPVRAIEEGIAFIYRNTEKKIKIGSVKRTETRTYPDTAVREAVINAVAHADYSQRGAPIRIAIYADRLEIENPGILPFGLTIPEVQKGISKLRNRVLGRVFHELKLIEQWGSGIQRMTSACRGAGLTDPILEEIGMHFRVTIKNAVGKTLIDVDKIDQIILSALSKGKGLSTRQIAKLIRRSTRAARTRMLILSEKGIVVEVGTSPRDPKRLYYLRSKQS